MSVVIPQHTLIEHNGHQIEAYVYGSGDEVIIMSAGHARPAAQFERLGRELAESGFCAVAYNYRGIGGSSGPMRGVTLHDLANDIWAIADSVGADRVHLVGKTMGNRVSRTAASDFPEHNHQLCAR